MSRIVSLFKYNKDWYHFLTENNSIVEVRNDKSMTPLLAFKRAQRKTLC